MGEQPSDSLARLWSRLVRDAVRLLWGSPAASSSSHLSTAAKFAPRRAVLVRAGGGATAQEDGAWAAKHVHPHRILCLEPPARLLCGADPREPAAYFGRMAQSHPDFFQRACSLNLLVVVDLATGRSGKGKEGTLPTAVMASGTLLEWVAYGMRNDGAAVLFWPANAVPDEAELAAHGLVCLDRSPCSALHARIMSEYPLTGDELRDNAAHVRLVLLRAGDGTGSFFDSDDAALAEVNSY